MYISFETLGCPKNFNDTEVAKGILENEGYIVSDNLVDADIVIVNTCGFINDAKKESIDAILDIAELKNRREKSGKPLILGVSGCLSKRYGQELFKEIPEVDFFVGVNEYIKLPEILSEVIGEKERKLYISEAMDEFQESSFRKLSDNPYVATIKISEGCNNRCTYCIIPSIRGHYRSRQEEDILKEAEYLAERGCKELILIAQDVTAYGMDIYGEPRLPDLVKKLCNIEKLQWIRLMYCYEDKITDELIEVMASEPKVCHYIDIPIQHGSDKILKLMNRKSTKDSIRKTIGKLRKAMPDIHIRTTLITGFPMETVKEFDELYDFVYEMKFERLGVFAYSKEEGTAAANLKGQVRSDVKERRRDSLMRLQIEQSLKTNQNKIGKIMEVMVEGEDEEEGTFIGRTRYDAPEIDNSVIFTSARKLVPGEIVNVLINDAFDYDIVGEHTGK